MAVLTLCGIRETILLHYKCNWPSFPPSTRQKCVREMSRARRWSGIRSEWTPGMWSHTQQEAMLSLTLWQSGFVVRLEILEIGVVGDPCHRQKQNLLYKQCISEYLLTGQLYLTSPYYATCVTEKLRVSSSNWGRVHMTLVRGIGTTLQQLSSTHKNLLRGNLTSLPPWPVAPSSSQTKPLGSHLPSHFDSELVGRGCI